MDNETGSPTVSRLFEFGFRVRLVRNAMRCFRCPSCVAVVFSVVVAVAVEVSAAATVTDAGGVDTAPLKFAPASNDEHNGEDIVVGSEMLEPILHI